MIPEVAAPAMRIASDVARMLHCNVMIWNWDATALVIKVGVNEMPTQMIRIPLAPDMSHEAIVEAVAQHVMAVLPLSVPDRPDAVRVCPHRWKRPKAMGSVGLIAQCTRCHAMGDFDPSTDTVTLWER